ncbi:RnaseH-domain-containing protein [Imleria badia]|nr:RnaseH-domain-containing protein [Imleria badia]
MTNGAVDQESQTTERKEDAQCSSGVYFGNGNPLNTSVRISGNEQSNQTAEITAILTALQCTDPTVPLMIITDSRYAMDGLTRHLPTWEDNGWTRIANSKWIKAATYHLRCHSAPTVFKWTKGHAGTPGNDEADALANLGNHRLQIDKHLARTTKRSPTSQQNTKYTWKHITSPKDISNDDWLNTNEVLVDITLPRPSEKTR